MSGSGMVIGTAAKLGLSAIGYDLDPLACMISRVNGTWVDEEKARNLCAELLSRCSRVFFDEMRLPWIDKETQQYIDFWFGPKQQNQLRALSYLLVKKPFTKNSKIVDVLKVAVSRLIITKEPKASLARDTAHSRPHRTIVENDFDVFEALPKSLDHVLRALNPSEIRSNAKVYRGDARKIGRVRDVSVDCIVTSPPYLNAIDYIRDHRLSLVWMGFSISQLRKIRLRSVGAEITNSCQADIELQPFFHRLHSDVDETKRNILKRYYRDLCRITNEAFRVLRPNRKAIYVIGNSRMKGHEIRNSELLIIAASRSGFRIIDQSVREIPENRRYMPLVNSGTSNLANRMRSEHVFIFEKAA